MHLWLEGMADSLEDFVIDHAEFCCFLGMALVIVAFILCCNFVLARWIVAGIIVIVLLLCIAYALSSVMAGAKRYVSKVKEKENDLV